MGEFKEKERLAIGKSTDPVHDNHAEAADASASLPSLLVHGWVRLRLCDVTPGALCAERTFLFLPQLA